MNRNLFKNANLKEIGQLRRYMSIIYDNADFYSKHFVNKTIIYTTKNKKIELTARRDNFMHLCGVTYIDGPRKFFNDAFSVIVIPFNSFICQAPNLTNNNFTAVVFS